MSKKLKLIYEECCDLNFAEILSKQSQKETFTSIQNVLKIAKREKISKRPNGNLDNFLKCDGFNTASLLFRWLKRRNLRINSMQAKPKDHIVLLLFRLEGFSEESGTGKIIILHVM